MSQVCDLSEAPTVKEMMEALRKQHGRWPGFVTFELTYRCNFQCPHCYCRLPASSPERHQELTLEEWDRIFAEAADLGALQALVTGGEPLLRPDFREIWISLKRKGLIPHLFTNAALVTEEIADFLAHWTPASVSVTLYAATEETYRAISGHEGMYQRVTEALQMLARRRVPLEVKTVVFRHNLHEFDAISEQIRRYNDPFRYDVDLIGALPGKGAQPWDCRLNPENLAEVELRTLPRREAWDKRVQEREAQADEVDWNRLFVCGAGRVGFAVDPYGNMNPCLIYQQEPYSLRQGSVREGWFAHIPGIIERRVDRSACRECEVAVYCTACPANAVLAGAPPEGPSPRHCEAAWERARTLQPGRLPTP